MFVLYVWLYDYYASDQGLLFVQLTVIVELLVQNQFCGMPSILHGDGEVLTVCFCATA